MMEAKVRETGQRRQLISQSADFVDDGGVELFLEKERFPSRLHGRPLGDNLPVVHQKKTQPTLNEN